MGIESAPLSARKGARQAINRVLAGSAGGLAALMSLALVLAGGGALAAESPALLGQAPLGPVEVSADRVSTDIKNRIIEYRGNIELDYGPLHLQAESLDYWHGEEGRIAIEGAPVRARIDRGEELSPVLLSASQVSMSRPYRLVVFTGEVYVSDADHRIKADTINFEIEAGRYTGEGVELLISDPATLAPALLPAEDSGSKTSGDASEDAAGNSNGDGSTGIQPQETSNSAPDTGGGTDPVERLQDTPP